MPKLGPQELQLRASPGGWPIWAIVSHIAVARVYWLCGVLKEPGAEKTPFPDPGEGWEDHLDVPRQSDELMFAVESSWQSLNHAWRAGRQRCSARRSLASAPVSSNGTRGSRS